jgi:hypothetical protein
MPAYASSQYRATAFSDFVEDLMDRASAEIRHAVGYVDAVVIPEARREAAVGARTMARYLDRLAEKLDPQNQHGGSL